MSNRLAQITQIIHKSPSTVSLAVTTREQLARDQDNATYGRGHCRWRQRSLSMAKCGYCPVTVGAPMMGGTCRQDPAESLQLSCGRTSGQLYWSGHSRSAGTSGETPVKLGIAGRYLSTLVEKDGMIKRKLPPQRAQSPGLSSGVSRLGMNWHHSLHYCLRNLHDRNA